MPCDRPLRRSPMIVSLSVLLLVGAAVAGAPRTADAQDSSRPRVEVASTFSSTIILPGVGALLSVRTGRKVAIEAGVDLLPWIIIEEDGNEAVLLFLAQVRLPWKDHADRRRSITVGFSSVAVVDRDWVSAGPGEPPRPTGRRLEFGPAVIPYGGITWQWHTDRAVHFRLDVQAFALSQPLPRVSVGVGWGGFRTASAASPRTSGR